MQVALHLRPDLSTTDLSTSFRTSFKGPAGEGSYFGRCSMRRASSLAAVLLLLVVTPLLGSGLLGSDEGTQTIHAGRLLDVDEGSLRSDVLIRIENGVITGIVDAGESEIPADVLDLSGYTVLPGLIDVHTHLCDNTWMGEAFDHWALPAPAFGVVGTVNARKVLRAGFTTVRNVSEPYYCGLALREAIARGWTEGPRIFASGPMISMTGGHGDWGSWMGPSHSDETPAEAVADGVLEVRKQVREHLKRGANLIKVAATGGFSSHGAIPGAASYSVDEIRAAVEEAAKRGLTVAAHAHGAAGIQNAIAAGVHSIEHASLMDDESIRQLKEQGVFLVADLLGAHYDLIETGTDWSHKGITDNRAEYLAYASRVERAYHAGVKMAFGTDSGVYPHGRNAEQFALMVDAGFTPIDALRSATIQAARLLGIETDTGSLEVGKRADLIAVKGNPLTDISTLTKVDFVMKKGAVVRWDGQPGEL